LTGQYASRCETENFLKLCPPGTPSIIGFNVQVPPGSWNVAAELKKNGYTTGFFGKWHTGGPPRPKFTQVPDLSDPNIKRQMQEAQENLSEYVRGAGFDVAERIYHGNIDENAGVKFHKGTSKNASDF
jgi:arylsulfatase A-like enzyme